MMVNLTSQDIPQALKRRRILLVGDCVALRVLHASFLRNMGFEHVYEASNGIEAIDMLRIRPADLIISDWVMPRLTGLELLCSVRSNPDFSTIPFLMLTSKKDTVLVERSLEMGATDYLIKPFKSPLLGMKIMMALAGSDFIAPARVKQDIHIRMIAEEASQRNSA